MDRDLVAGLIGRAGTVGGGVPAQEYLTRRGGEAGGGHYICVGAIGVALAVLRHCAIAVVGIISYAERRIAGIVGEKGNITVNQGVKVKRDIVAFLVQSSPAAPGVALGDFNLRQLGFLYLGAVGDFNALGSTITFHGQVCGTGEGGSSPLGVDGDIPSWHCAGEGIRLALALLIIIPAHKGILGRNACGTLGSVGNIGDIRLILLGNGALYISDIDKLDLIAVAGIVELGAVIGRSVLCTDLRIFGKTSDIIEVFRSHCGSGHYNRV